jgi:hypothetical protein
MLDFTNRHPRVHRQGQIELASRPSVRIDAEVLATVALLSAVFAIGAATVTDYGITVDEFNAQDYGRKALAWFTSAFQDRSMFDSVEDTLWYYGPWFHMLIAWAQSVVPADPWTIRHAMTFTAGMLGIAALLPIGRLVAGRWAGFVAISLCLGTGYLYGSLFATPIDVPFLLAMTWTTLAVMVMARNVVPTWPATLAAGVLAGLTVATRVSGVITQVYLVGAMSLCALEALVSPVGSSRDLSRIAARTIAALACGWIVTLALWPWLQIGNPIDQFKAAFLYFANHPHSFETRLWGRMVVTTDLPWSYIPEQLIARLPEAFLLLLALGLLFTAVDLVRFVGGVCGSDRSSGGSRITDVVLAIARERTWLVLWAAVLLPIGFIIAAHSTLYDGVRHVLFLIPLLGVIGGYGFVRLAPVLRRVPVAASAVGGLYAGAVVWYLAVLHPLEYVAMNTLAGGVSGAYGHFELDYWALAATVALRRLEYRLDYRSPASSAQTPPSITICIGYREALVSPLFRRPWRLETDPAKADYIIATEGWPCADSLPNVVLIDEVKRFGRAFAGVYARQSLVAD